MVEPTVFAYWEGPSRHWFYDLCWETVTRWNPQAKLLCRADVESVIGPVPPELDDVYIVHRVDWMRKKFIAAVGGLWVDMDFICWSDLSPLVGLSKTFDFCGWQEWHGTGWMDNFFLGRSGSPVLATAADYALDQVRQHGKDVRWLATSSEAMNHALEVHKWGLWMQIPTHLIGPVSVMDREWFQQNSAVDMHQYISLGFMTSVHSIGGWLNTYKSPQDLIESPTNMGKLLRRGLKL